MRTDHRQAFRDLFPTDNIYGVGRPGSPAERCLQFVTFARPAAREHAAAIARHLSSVGAIVHNIALAACASLRAPLGDHHQPDRAFCERYGAGLSRRRDEALAALEREGISIDVRGLSALAAKEILAGGDPYAAFSRELYAFWGEKRLDDLIREVAGDSPAIRQTRIRRRAEQLIAEGEDDEEAVLVAADDVSQAEIDVG